MLLRLCTQGRFLRTCGKQPHTVAVVNIILQHAHESRMQFVLGRAGNAVGLQQQWSRHTTSHGSVARAVTEQKDNISHVVIHCDTVMTACGTTSSRSTSEVKSIPMGP